jgi:hypothetical protein
VKRARSVYTFGGDAARVFCAHCHAPLEIRPDMIPALGSRLLCEECGHSSAVASIAVRVVVTMVDPGPDPPSAEEIGESYRHGPGK